MNLVDRDVLPEKYKNFELLDNDDDFIYLCTMIIGDVYFVTQDAYNKLRKVSSHKRKLLKSIQDINETLKDKFDKIAYSMPDPYNDENVVKALDSIASSMPDSYNDRDVVEAIESITENIPNKRIKK